MAVSGAAVCGIICAMPIYQYEACDPRKSCRKCKDGFEIAQSIRDERLTVCPECGAPVFRVICAPALAHSRTDLNYRAKRAGFHSYKKVQKGEYEKLY